MSDAPYRMSFTTGGLFHHESVELANLFLQLGDWKAVSHQVIEQNRLQTRTLSSLKRLSREVINRLSNLNACELAFFVETTPQNQRHLLWIATCRQYQFIAAFAVEVLRERFLNLKTVLALEDFDAFLNRKSDWHPELDNLQSTTRSKLRQVLFRMLREAGLITTNHEIQPALLSAGMAKVLAQRAYADLQFFPAFDTDVKGMSR